MFSSMSAFGNNFWPFIQYAVVWILCNLKISAKHSPMSTGRFWDGFEKSITCTKDVLKTFLIRPVIAGCIHRLVFGVYAFSLRIILQATLGTPSFSLILHATWDMTVLCWYLSRLKDDLCPENIFFKLFNIKCVVKIEYAICKTFFFYTIKKDKNNNFVIYVVIEKNIIWKWWKLRLRSLKSRAQNKCVKNVRSFNDLEKYYTIIFF